MKDRTSKIIHIAVDPDSYLKYIAMCITRTAGNIIDLNDAEISKALKNHIVIKEIARKITNCSKGSLREWARLSLFSGNGQTITLLLKDTIPERIDYTFNFDWFYDKNKTIEKCYEIIKLFNIEAKQSIDHLFEAFYNNNPNREIDVLPNQIIDSMNRKENLNFENLNFLQEAWIDNWLVDRYNVAPLLKDVYFTNTQSIIDQYQL